MASGRRSARGIRVDHTDRTDQLPQQRSHGDHRRLLTAEPLILGIDDLRPLPRASCVARTSKEGIRLLQEHRDEFIDELWLDHDLGGDDSIMPIVTLLEEAAFNGEPFQIGTIFVHSANPSGAETVVRVLTWWPL
ncbi:cyclic-phosphate processing receiver domain-containing protein [Nonomuraea sp. NPDC052129]|uniref:cyclic-phosphate processing receiver domain-containing protein n=1 Tax=Nonomuraea sp. NPDC052129 TaxID=3154651 RepID=UPI003422F73D